jgi:hypothetical protein
MPSFATREHALANRHYNKLPNGTITHVSSCIGVNSVERKATGLPPRLAEAFPPPLEPIAFLVEQAANMSIPGHYHQADQFQVFVAGGGKFGIKPIEGLTVHYAMGFTPYAPIHAAAAGVEYYTLRNGWDPGARWMPDYKEGLKGRTKDYRHGLGLIPALVGEAEGPQNLATVIEHTVVPFEADGLGATLYHAAPGQHITGPAPSEGRGQYWMVMSGECQLNEHLGGKQALLFVDPTEPAPSITAGSTGASVLLMQFPKRVH